jgi:hypothetical protein
MTGCVLEGMLPNGRCLLVQQFNFAGIAQHWRIKSQKAFKNDVICSSTLHNRLQQYLLAFWMLRTGDRQP